MREPLLCSLSSLVGGVPNTSSCPFASLWSRSASSWLEYCAMDTAGLRCQLRWMYQIVGQGMPARTQRTRTPRAHTSLSIWHYLNCPSAKGQLPAHSIVLGLGSDVLMSGKQAGAGLSHQADVKASFTQSGSSMSAADSLSR